MANQQHIVDLINGAYIQVGGEIGRYHTLPIEDLVKLANNFQKLIIALAKFDSDDSGLIDLNNFKVELAGFRKGSAVPMFVLTPRIREVIGDGVQEQRNQLNQKFNELMRVSDRGSYYDLKELYPNAVIRNSIVEPLYEFTSSSGNSPTAFVRFEKGKPIPIVQVKRFKKEVRDDLITTVVEPKKKSPKEHRTGFARIAIPADSGDKPDKRAVKIKEIYADSRHSIDYAPEVIVFEDRVYHLRHPLRCKFEHIDDYYVIESEMLDIIGTGETEDDAEQSFNQEFDFVYRRYNELPEEKLSARIRMIRQNMNWLVTGVE